MLTRKLLSVIDNIIVDVFKIICCNLQSELSDSFMVNITVAQLPGHKVLQPGHVPRLPPPSPWRRHCSSSKNVRLYGNETDACFKLAANFVSRLE